MENLEINTSLARSILTGFIRSETQRAGFNKVVLGLSGGIDSALSCYLAAEALGRKTCWQCACPTRPPARNRLTTRSW